MVPKREIDPYVMNDIRGTRMPEYTKLNRTRDVFGELGWIPNFEKKKSKDNDKRYTTCKEYFDAPLNYHNEFSSQTMTTASNMMKTHDGAQTPMPTEPFSPVLKQ